MNAAIHGSMQWTKYLFETTFKLYNRPFKVSPTIVLIVYIYRRINFKGEKFLIIEVENV